MLSGPIFIALLTALLVIESIAPRRPRPADWLEHAVPNLALVLLALVVNAVLGAFLVSFATRFVATEHAGILQRAPLPEALRVVLAAIALELLGWPLHVLKHRIPWLWRLHRLHHEDEHIDATSALKFHPIELLLNAGWLSASILLLGAPPLAVTILAAVAVPLSLVQHANIPFPARLDRFLRFLIVTPAVHQTHHSSAPEDSASNYASILTLSDRLMRTYRLSRETSLRFGSS